MKYRINIEKGQRICHIIIYMEIMLSRIAKCYW